MHRVILSLGSNRAPEHHLALGLDALTQRFGPLSLSSVYESEPVGIHDAHNFYNLVVAFDSIEGVEALHGALKTVEQSVAQGLTRPKALDIDLLSVGELHGRIAGITLPRDDITRHAFVLRPLAELEPDTHHPVLALSYAALWQCFEHKAHQRLWPVDFFWRGRQISRADG
ncbi:2-amino-4-hydroxy-6-hydroxymethyldihydropteridine diphosphokinase [Halomonas dongshanensis]|uniref:2-amino-4-hydroxy-6-hydroxymethyldihydropteridine diphosphokinase n=1 Tax=Halomonas dongshanensis TaxID=2890835 RepID=A0ABT2EF29_9GAMM|nr:2-amino-4-hydroxy-6-hydroxymethyldihydropteridine diphosphokinase [Halomonas dongshanensis]MCS2609710.1 2-amino-4-hydroxy-6-hydroxymethyldihydropteridine diphosphokinase [Halomonas dongshanensis]